jgi:hypothetical protein
MAQQTPDCLGLRLPRHLGLAAQLGRLPHRGHSPSPARCRATGRPQGARLRSGVRRLPVSAHRTRAERRRSGTATPSPARPSPT